MLKRIALIFGYFGLALVIVGSTVALVAYGNDYVYDFSTRSIIQKGHVIINSLPNGVRITEDGKLLKKKTPYQAAYKVGTHTFELAKDGFHPWKKALEVVAGRVALANYVILLPLKPETRQIDVKPQIISQSISKDHRHLAYVTGGADAAVYILDLPDGKAVKLYTPRAATPTQPAEVLQGVTWSDDASHVLITSDLGGQPLHLFMAASANASVLSLTEKFGFNLSGLQFSGSNWRQLYWISPDGLRRLDADAQTVSGVLADKVTQFWIQPERVMYVRRTEFGSALWSLDSKGRRTEIVAALPASDSYTVAYSKFSGDDHVVVIPASTQTATLYTAVFGDTPSSKVLAHGVTGARFSPDGHVLALTAPTTIQTYDLERSALLHEVVMYTVAGLPGTLTSLEWFDDHHFIMTRDNVAYWSEFDGANRVELGATYGGFALYSSSDTRSIYATQPAVTGAKISQIVIR